MKNFVICLMAALLTTTVACVDSEPTEKPEAPTPNLIDGKADGSNTRQLGPIGFGEEGARQNPIPAAMQYDSYEINMAQGGIASFEISQRGTSRGFDSLLYIFGPRDTDGRYSSEIVARDDDSGWGQLSRIRNFEATEGGTYMVVVGSFKGQGQYRILAQCENDACVAPEPSGECVFGNSYPDLIHGRAPATTITYSTSVKNAAELTEMEGSQLVQSLTVSGFDDISTAEEAMNTIDAGELNILHVWDVSNQRGYEVLEYALGDTSVGTIYEAGTTRPAAVISDSDLYDCIAFRGDARRDCATNADCASGLRCEGVVNGVGSCIDTNHTPEGYDADCTTSRDCSDGLVCVGGNYGGGMCGDAWMRRRFFAQPDIAIEGPVTTITLDTYGLATAHTDVSIYLAIAFEDVSKLRITLKNSSETESIIHDFESNSEIYLRGEAVMGFPGDENANGTWTLTIENSDVTATGSVWEFGLEVTSRWD